MSVGGIVSFYYCSETMSDGGKTTETFWKHETLRYVASAVFKTTSVQLMLIPSSLRPSRRQQNAALWASRKVSHAGWGDNLDSSRAALLSSYALRYLESSDVKKWLHENWSTWVRSSPLWFTAEWRMALGARLDFPADFLPPKAVARIKREKERREAGELLTRAPSLNNGASEGLAAGALLFHRAASSFDEVSKGLARQQSQLQLGPPC